MDTEIIEEQDSTLQEDFPDILDMEGNFGLNMDTGIIELQDSNLKEDLPDIIEVQDSNLQEDLPDILDMMEDVGESSVMKEPEADHILEADLIRRHIVLLMLHNQLQGGVGDQLHGNIGMHFIVLKYLPESLLREDDVSYETVKTSVRRGFGACTGEGGHHIVKDYLQLLETNAAPSGSSVKFEKTRWKMKKYIKEYLPKILRDQNHKGRQMGLLKQLSQLLKDPHNFRENHVTLVTPISHSHCSAVTELLKGLEDMPFQTLNAMHRRLKGVRGGVPQLQPPRSGWNRNRLIKQVKMTWEKMLSEHDEGGELQVPLAKAMAVAGLSFKVTTGYQNPSLMEFHHFSPEIEALQNEILNAIWLLKEKVRSSELKDVLLLLDPDANFSNGVVRTSVRKMLIEYLFECSEMDSIPKSLLETLAMINRSSRSALSTCISKEEAEEELECVLSVSGQIKQIVWDLVPDHEFDQDFTDAYMEDLEESDDDENQLELSNIQISKSHSHNSNDQVESIGESLQIDSILPTPTSNGNCSSELSLHNTRLNGKSIDGSKTEQFIGLDSGDLHVYGFSSSFQESSILHEKQNMKGNHYLSIQEVCDETSMVAHQLTGRLLEEFAQIEGLDLDRTERSYLRGGNSNPGDFQDEMQTSSKDDLDGPLLVRIIEELIPSLPKSVLTMLSSANLLHPHTLESLVEYISPLARNKVKSMLQTKAQHILVNVKLLVLTLQWVDEEEVESRVLQESRELYEDSELGKVAASKHSIEALEKMKFEQKSDVWFA
ncbi:hypothetical protein HHK36_019937 [Tetracentron sinense]|uniref:Uncharacterized protein n=1 Tax=Tetracentron sinense TaxID=13715 RepID=A0A835DB59_TETSI|nr:hypothetical protein HHK36_019937 [Tetracentron sinense]